MPVANVRRDDTGNPDPPEKLHQVLSRRPSGYPKHLIDLGYVSDPG